MSRWAGMMTMSTLAAMMVPIAAPMWRYAARGLRSWASAHASAVASRNSVAPRAVDLRARETAARGPAEGAGAARGHPPLGRRRGEPAVQPVEVERRADPGDASDHVGPAQREVEPLLEVSAHGGGGSAAAIGRVAERADEQRDVILLGIAYLEHDLDERMERCDSQGREVRPRVEAQAVGTGG